MGMDDVNNIEIIGRQINKKGAEIEQIAKNFKGEFGKNKGVNRSSFIIKVEGKLTDLEGDINTIRTYLSSV